MSEAAATWRFRMLREACLEGAPSDADRWQTRPASGFTGRTVMVVQSGIAATSLSGGCPRYTSRRAAAGEQLGAPFNMRRCVDGHKIAFNVPCICNNNRQGVFYALVFPGFASGFPGMAERSMTATPG